MDRQAAIDEVTEGWEYSWSALIVEGDEWIAIAGDEVDSDEARGESPFPFVVRGDAPDRERVAQMLNEKFKTRTATTAHDVIEEMYK